MISPSALSYLTAACLSWILVATASSDSTATGVLEGHVKIVSSKEVNLADASPSPNVASNYADYPLLILNKQDHTKITEVTPDDTGKYRVALPPGEYILDVQRRRPKGHLRATPEAFTIAASQTVRVDMAIDTGVR
jgi:hypothetical protein